MISDEEKKENGKYKMREGLRKQIRRSNSRKKWRFDDKPQEETEIKEPKDYRMRASDIRNSKRMAQKEKELDKKYGITRFQYVSMRARQKGRCAICKTHQRDLPIALCVDHCHKTGKIRGLLCTKCNLGIGYLQDNTSLLQTAARYLKRYSLKNNNF